MATKKLRMGVLAGSALVASVLSAQQSQAATIYSTDFSTTDGFSNGNLPGQTGGTPTARQWFQTPATPASITAAVNSGTAVITATSLSSNNSAGGGDIGVFYPSITAGTVNTATTPIVTFSGSLAVTATAGTYPGFGFQVFGGATPTQNPIFSAFELGDGTIDYQGNGAVANPATVYTGTNTFTGTLDYSTGIYALAINGTLFASGTFDTSSGFGGVSLSAATFDSTAGASGTGTFDNFSITAQVPEPTTASLVVGGLAAAGLRRRRVAR